MEIGVGKWLKVKVSWERLNPLGLPSTESLVKRNADESSSRFTSKNYRGKEVYELPS